MPVAHVKHRPEQSVEYVTDFWLVLSKKKTNKKYKLFWDSKPYKMETAILDAADMNIFESESFDVVLNMGPFYHLADISNREECMNESLRALKKGGLLVTAYIPRYFVFQYVAMQNKDFLVPKLARQIIETDELHHDDEKCFWTDTYYSTYEEMERLYQQHDVAVIDHFAQDGMTAHLSEKVDNWNDKEFKIWCDYHYSICRERSILGASNHVIIIGQK